MVTNNTKQSIGILYDNMYLWEKEIVAGLHILEENNQKYSQARKDTLQAKNNHIILIKEILKKCDIGYFHQTEPISPELFGYTFENNFGSKKYSFSYKKEVFTLKLNNKIIYKGYSKVELLDALNKKPNNFLSIKLFIIVGIVTSILFYKDDIKNLLATKTKKFNIVKICESSIEKRYSYDNLIYLKQKKINSTQDNEIGVQFKDTSSGKIITTIYSINTDRCAVANTNSGHIY